MPDSFNSKFGGNSQVLNRTGPIKISTINHEDDKKEPDDRAIYEKQKFAKKRNVF